ncbi:hypothetical protein D6D01_05652 [Aureobasidium pullulans]|uniref:Flavin reductase like domain-containing protein n=1 Tax=Aureobasidium pullulans TaxID=5580 RepID=A0A4V4JV51_AURPU|nr:hypothetical protein D6D01_05652 [Aureobasidium pullulans]
MVKEKDDVQNEKRALQNWDTLRSHAVYGTTIEPVTEPPQDQSETAGLQAIRVVTPERRIWTMVKGILRLENAEEHDFDKYSSSLANQEHAGEDKQVETSDDRVEISYHMPRRVFGLLTENDSELMSKIEERFMVRIKVRTRKGSQRPGIFIKGKQDAATKALNFIKSVDFPAEESTPVQLKPDEIKETYKTAMRSVPSSVVVLTTHDGSSGAKVTLDSIRGMTVSSMTSVTLEPEPIVSFSIRGPSRTLDCVNQGQPFYVNFLADNRQGALIAGEFAQYHEDPSQPFRTLEEQELTSISPHMDSRGPYFKGRDNPAYFKCELLPGKSIEIGDHTVIFARVVHIWASPRMYKQRLNLLAYAQTQYHALAKRPIDLTPPEPSVAQPQQQTTTKSEASQTPQGPTAAEIEEAKTAQEFNDKYWSMATGEGEEEEGILEERAADQRAVGDAEKPADFDKK